jgi:uncharacterized OsmC-like protein
LRDDHQWARAVELVTPIGIQAQQRIWLQRKVLRSPIDTGSFFRREVPLLGDEKEGSIGATSHLKSNGREFGRASNHSRGRIVSRKVFVDTARTPYVQEIMVGGHRLLGDEPSEAGGTDAGPGPYELLLAALGTCTCITVRIYAERRHWPLEAVHTALTHAKVHADDCVACESEIRSVDQIEMEIALTGDLSAEQEQRLLEIAGKCPVHRTLRSQVKIHTRVVQRVDIVT